MVVDVAQCYLDGNADAAEFCPIEPYRHVLAASTYTLQEEGERPSRSGSVSLFSVDRETRRLELSHRVETAGIFDIKWSPIGGGSSVPLLGQADADGFLRIHGLHSVSDGTEDVSLKEVTEKKISSSMCLYLDWDPCATSIAIGLSDGSAAITSFSESRLETIREWKAHDFEVWTAAFDPSRAHVLYTGSDDCTFAGWDLRGPDGPAFRNSRAHKMGVCCVAPTSAGLVLTGSYDEGLRAWDLRSVSRPVEEVSVGLGGGVWRVKPNPNDPGLVLAACMHNGFAIVRIDGNEARVLERYGKHGSLAYGCDWHRGDPKLVATCSFYDKLLRVWIPEADDHNLI